MRPEHLPLIRAFDHASSMAFGLAAALAAASLIPDAWWAPLAMVAGMCVGVVAALPIFGVLSLLLGGFETVVMFLQIGMVGGMTGAMLRGAPAGVVALAGVASGFLVHAALRLVDRSLHGEVVDPAGDPT